MKKKLITFLTLTTSTILLTTCLTACSPMTLFDKLRGASADDQSTSIDQSSGTSNESDSSNQSGSSAGTDSYEDADAKAQDEALLQELQTWIDDPANHVVLLENFSNVEEVPWQRILVESAMRGYVGREFDDDDDEMVQEFLEMTGKEDDRAARVRVMSDEDIANYVKEKTGASFKMTKAQADQYEDAWYYSDKFKVWYCYCSYLYSVPYEYEGIPEYEFECTQVSSDGDDITLFAGSYAHSDCHKAEAEIHLKKTDDGYQILTNKIVWDRGSIKKYSLSLPHYGDVDVYLYDDYRFIDNSTHEPTGKYSYSAALTQNGDFLQWLSIEDSLVDDAGLTTDIYDVQVCDYNIDNEPDIIVTGKCERGNLIMLFSWDDSDYDQSYCCDYGCSRYASKELGTTDASEVINLLTDGKEKTGFADYKEAFKWKARNCAVIEGEDDVTFSLIYFNNDDIPELVAGHTGYSVSIYQFVDGYVIPIISGWPYGAGGNAGYCYNERCGMISYLDQNGAGAEYYETYLKYNEETHQMETVLYYHGVNDTEGDWGEPGYFACSNGEATEITEEEYNALLKEYYKDGNGKSGFLEGERTLAEILDELSD